MSLVATGLVLGLVPLLVAAQKDEMKTQATKITGVALMAPSDQKWVPMPGLEGATQCTLWGDSTKEAHRILYKWPAGTKAPLHTHTAGDRGIVISGTLGLAVDGAPVKKLPPGSYFSLASGTKHVTSVEGDTACMFYIEREGAFDAVFIDEKGAK
jgi:quercetin dioxygenase-like cupin family protein